MEFKINGQEHSALRGLPYLQRVLYVCGLRPYMDYTSGLVGVRRKISYQSLREELYIDPHPGLKSGSPSRQQIQRALEGLERAGLIQRHPENSLSRALILTCCLASYDHCIQKKPDAKPIHQADVASIQNNPLKSGDFEEQSLQGETLHSTQSDTPPVSGNNISLSKKGETCFFIPENFEPSSTVLDMARYYACPNVESNAELIKFIAYHQSKGTKRRDWNAEFLYWLLRSKQYYEEKGYAKRTSTLSKRTERDKYTSAVDRVFSANQALIERDCEIIDYHG